MINSYTLLIFEFIDNGNFMSIWLIPYQKPISMHAYIFLYNIGENVEIYWHLISNMDVEIQLKEFNKGCMPISL